jgi:hypothetical protein
MMRSYICDHECDVNDPESIQRNLASATLDWRYSGEVVVWYAVKGVGMGSVFCARKGNRWYINTETMPWVFCFTVFRVAWGKHFNKGRQNRRWRKRKERLPFLHDCRALLLQRAMDEARKRQAPVTEGGEYE